MNVRLILAILAVLALGPALVLFLPGVALWLAIAALATVATRRL